MKLLPFVRVPIPNRPAYGSFATTPGSDITIQTDRVAVFELKKFVRREEVTCIYECTNEKCRGCGCPPFAITEDIPQEVWDHIHIHVELCEGLVRSSVPQ